MAAEVIRWLLDTNIVSELARERPSAAVMQRFAQRERELALPAVVWHELLYGVARLPAGQRRQRLSDFVEQVAGALPTLAYDAAVARVHALLRADSAACGRVLCEPDAQIAATALTHGLTLVTRNLRDFDGITGLQIENWFESSAS
jgi:tRNA(fMet)-specific endonuclease VapC